MASQTALSQARHVKATCAAAATAAPAAALDANVWSRAGNPQDVHCVSYRDIAQAADRELESWRDVHAGGRSASNRDLVQYSFDGHDHLRDWIASLPVDDLAACIDATPASAGYTFTPWQRLSMHVVACAPYDTTASLTIDAQGISALSLRTDVTHRRSQPIRAHMSVMRGSFLEVTVVDIPTAGGKSGWSAALAGMTLGCGDRWTALVQAFRNDRLDTVVCGSPFVEVARMAIVAVGATVFDHFVSTIRALIDTCLKHKYPRVRFQLWTGVSANLSIMKAARGSDDVVTFWVIPVSKLNSVLKKDPEVAVAMCITDEYTVDTPRDRSKSQLSSVAKHLILCATPHALQDATTGSTSWFKEYMEGYFFAPCAIRALVGRHAYKDAELACRQLCKFDCMTLSHFREHIRNDLSHLVPPAIEIFYAPSRRLTLASHVTRSDNDLVPRSLLRTLVEALGTFYPTRESRDALHAFLLTPQAVRPGALADHIQGMCSTRTSGDLTQVDACRNRIVARVREFDAECCPICMREADEAPAASGSVGSNVRMYGCCGMCVCAECFDRTTRCPFCRTPIAFVSRASEAIVVDDALEGDDGAQDGEWGTGETNYPSVTRLREARVFGGTLAASIRDAVRPHMKQMYNVTVAVHCLMHHGHRRLLIVCEVPMHIVPGLQMVGFSTSALTQATGCRIHQVDDRTLTGNGTRFAALKAAFDDVDDAAPMALATFGLKLLVGANLDVVDAVVAVGRIPDRVLTQALGRVFRPRATRDNSRPIPMVRVYSR